jgi:hypothetical protein
MRLHRVKRESKPCEDGFIRKTDDSDVKMYERDERSVEEQVEGCQQMCARASTFLLPQSALGRQAIGRHHRSVHHSPLPHKWLVVVQV